MASGGDGLREAVAGVRGYEAQRAMVSPSAQVGGPATTADALGEGAGMADADEGAGMADAQSEESGMADAQSEESGADPNSGMLAAGPNRGGGKGGAKSRQGKRGRAKWPSGVPRPPVIRVWIKYGPSKADPGDWFLQSDSSNAFGEARKHNNWLKSLPKPQLDAVRLYRYCKVGAVAACRNLESSQQAGTASAAQIKTKVDEAIGYINTAATRIGGAAAMIDKAMDKAGSAADKTKLKKARGVLSRVSKGLRGLTSLLGDVTTGVGLYTDALALASAAVDLTTKGVTDETLKAVIGAAGVLLKDTAIAFVPPQIGVTLTIANAIMCEIEPKWVEKTVGLFFDDSPAPKPKARPAPPRTSRGGSIADQINWR